jgi:hypothetical protein
VNFCVESEGTTCIVEPCFTGSNEGAFAVSLLEQDNNKKEIKRNKKVEFNFI